MKDDLRYSVEDCLETFPFPASWKQNSALLKIGSELEERRKQYMVSNSIGLTEFYNRIHSPENTSKEILSLRNLVREVDRCVFDAYSWNDIQPEFDFFEEYEVPEGKKKPWRYRWPDETREQVLSRLLSLNKERYQLEQS